MTQQEKIIKQHPWLGRPEMVVGKDPQKALNAYFKVKTEALCNPFVLALLSDDTEKINSLKEAYVAYKEAVKKEAEWYNKEGYTLFDTVIIPQKGETPLGAIASIIHKINKGGE